MPIGVPSLSQYETNLKATAFRGSTSVPVAGPFQYVYYYGVGGIYRNTLAGVDADNHYDPIESAINLANYAAARTAQGDMSWSPRTYYLYLEAARRQIRDLYVLPNNGAVPGYHNWTAGFTRDFVQNGDEQSRLAAVAMSRNAAYAVPGTDQSTLVAAAASRETAAAVMSFMDGEICGAGPRSETAAYLSLMFGHIDQWISHLTVELPAIAAGAAKTTCVTCQPFMASITAQALIQHWTRQRNTVIAGIPAKVKLLADTLWNTLWDPGSSSFPYNSFPTASLPNGCVQNDGGPTPAPDLNTMIAPMYYWLAWYLGDPTYSAKADTIFAGAPIAQTIGAYTQKEYHQNSRWMLRSGGNWRDRAQSEWPAATAISVATPTGPTGYLVVRLSGTKFSAAQPVVVTPTAPGVIFTPTSQILTTEEPQTAFRSNAAAAYTLSLANSSGLAVSGIGAMTSPAIWPFTLQQIVPAAMPIVSPVIWPFTLQQLVTRSQPVASPVIWPFNLQRIAPAAITIVSPVVWPFALQRLTTSVAPTVVTAPVVWPFALQRLTTSVAPTVVTAPVVWPFALQRLTTSVSSVVVVTAPPIWPFNVQRLVPGAPPAVIAPVIWPFNVQRLVPGAPPAVIAPVIWPFNVQRLANSMSANPYTPSLFTVTPFSGVF